VIVIDASAMTEFLLQTALGARVETRLVRDGADFHAPQLLDLEVTQALRRMVRTGEVRTERAGQALDDLMELDVHLHSHRPLLGRVWSLRGNLTAYDAAYVALAEALDADLITCDVPLAGSPGHRARIDLVR
jgi:predicted nucleic acid-binding protein